MIWPFRRPNASDAARILNTHRANRQRAKIHARVDQMRRDITKQPAVRWKR